jgi:DNA invertase Pin-like site-specific DNA recombinase
MSVIYGYARCSTDETRQDIDRQKRELFAMGVKEDKHIYWEYESGTKEDRAELMKLLDVIREGDTVAATEVSRLTRSTKQLCDILQTVQEKKIRLLIGSFSVDCRSENIDPMTKGMLMMWGVFSEMERDIISQRVRSGMKNAAAKGKQIGRPKTTVDTLPDKFWKYYKLYENGEITVSECARLMDCSRTTIYKYKDIAGACK